MQDAGLEAFSIRFLKNVLPKNIPQEVLLFCQMNLNFVFIYKSHLSSVVQEHLNKCSETLPLVPREGGIHQSLKFHPSRI